MSKGSSSSRTNKPVLRRKGSAITDQSMTDTGESRSAVLDVNTRRAMIAEAAYYRAEHRGFTPGFELEDWLLSENELAAQVPASMRGQALEKSRSSSAELH